MTHDINIVFLTGTKDERAEILWAHPISLRSLHDELQDWPHPQIGVDEIQF